MSQAFLKIKFKEVMCIMSSFHATLVQQKKRNDSFFSPS